MDNNKIIGYDEMIEKIDDLLIKTPDGRKQLLKWLDSEIDKLTEELGVKKVYTITENGIFTYEELTPKGEIIQSHKRVLGGKK